MDGNFLVSRVGQGFIENLQWFLGISLEYLKSLGPTAVASEAPSDVQMHAANLRVVHMTIACITRIIELTPGPQQQSLSFQQLPACLLEMLQMKRFQTLNAAGAKTIQISVQNSALLERLCVTPNFVSALKVSFLFLFWTILFLFMSDDTNN